MFALLAVAVAFSFGEVRVECENPGDWKLTAKHELAADGAEVLRFVMDAPTAQVPPKTWVSFEVPMVGMYSVWNVNETLCRMPPDWGSSTTTELARGLPVYAYFDHNDTAHFTVAASECVHMLRYAGGAKEAGSRLHVRIGYFDTVEAPISHYETCVRLDARARNFADAVRESVAWVERTGGYVPCAVPEAAFDPLYSSWYCFHKDLHAADVEAELALAARLGMKNVILDDGWQTDRQVGIYDYCGDWQVAKTRFPEGMAAHVAKAHALGLKYMMWYSVPFVGIKSANFERFRGKYLTENLRGLNAAVLDPRFPEVRKFLVDIYAQAVKDYDLDGLKLDFIDSIAFTAEGDPAVKENYAGRDLKSVPLAVDRLMVDIHDALEAIRPGILIEFRQSYVGPAIRKYGNMLRVGDCPCDMRRNRFAIANLRLAAGSAAVHSDMLEWNFQEPPEAAALNIINSIFGVVQYSVMLREAPQAHRDMIAKWIKFSQDHRATLLKGRFMPHHPELQYPVIEAESDAEVVIGVYDDGRVVDVPSAKKTFVMNASGRDGLVIRRGGKLETVACRSGDFVELN